MQGEIRPKLAQIQPGAVIEIQVFRLAVQPVDHMQAGAAVEAAVHIHPFFQRKQMPGFDPAVQGDSRVSIVRDSVSGDLSEALDGEIGQVLKRL